MMHENMYIPDAFSTCCGCVLAYFESFKVAQYKHNPSLSVPQKIPKNMCIPKKCFKNCCLKRLLTSAHYSRTTVYWFQVENL